MKKLPLKNVLAYHKELSDLPDTYSLERKALSTENLISEDSKIIGIMSTIGCDSDNDILMPNGCDFSRYEKNSVICWNHALDLKPLGKIENIVVSDTDIRGELKFSESYDEAVTVKNLIKEGILKTLSVGYIPVEILKKGTKAFNDYAAKFKLDVTECVRIVSKWLIIETSVVAVPSNEDALILYSGKNFMSDAMKKSLHIEIKGCKEDENKVITEDNVEVSPEETVQEVQDILIVEKVNEDLPNEEVSEINTDLPEASGAEDTQTLPEASTDVQVEPEVVDPSTDTASKEPQIETPKPIVIKVLRKGKKLITEDLQKKARLFLAGKSF